jgi:hypothetical protein
MRPTRCSSGSRTDAVAGPSTLKHGGVPPTDGTPAVPFGAVTPTARKWFCTAHRPTELLAGIAGEAEAQAGRHAGVRVLVGGLAEPAPWLRLRLSLPSLRPSGSAPPVPSLLAPHIRFRIHSGVQRAIRPESVVNEPVMSSTPTTSSSAPLARLTQGSRWR